MVAVPSIHLNGTSRAELLRGYLDAHTVIEVAIDQLRKTVPNGRDYYVQDDGAFRIAVREHEHRVSRLLQVQEELMEIAEAISEK